MISLLSERQRNEIVDLLAQALAEGITELEEDKRYLLLVRDADHADEIAKLVYDALDLENVPNLRLVIVSGNVKLLEF